MTHFRRAVAPSRLLGASQLRYLFGQPRNVSLDRHEGSCCTTDEPILLPSQHMSDPHDISTSWDGAPEPEGWPVHGRPVPVLIDALLDDDPDVWLASADMRAWLEAHPCECEALCECDQVA
jgi:hypothetical protein